jgi:hypothetical protein
MTMFVAPPLLDTLVRPDADPQKRPMGGLATGVAVSLLLHALLLILSPKPDHDKQGIVSPTRGPLMVQLRPPPVAVPDQAPPPAPAPAPVKSKPTPRTVIAASKPSPLMPAVPIEPPRPPEPLVPEKKAPAPPSLSDFIAARKAQRQAQEEAISRYNSAMRAAENDPNADESANAAIRRNMQSLARRGDGTSGVFRITHKGTRTGAFAFRGWSGDASNSWRQTYEVDAGLGGNVELAIVKKMIELIRMHYQGDFNWESQRLGRVVVLSARQADNAGLEEFLMKEFFALEQ